MEKPDSIVVTLSRGWSFPLFGLQPSPSAHESCTNNLASFTIQAFRGNHRELVGIDTGLWTLPARLLAVLHGLVGRGSARFLARRLKESLISELVEVPGCVRVNSTKDVFIRPFS